MDPTEPEPPPVETDEILRAKLNAETGQIAWTGLQRFFAQGKVIHVTPGTDLLEVAIVIARDRKDALEQWVETGAVRPVSDDQAREWVAADAMMWSVIVRPWVLVQPILASSDAGDAG